MRAAVTAIFLAALAVPAAAQDSAHPVLDELIARAEAADPNADPAAYHANFVAALEEARKHYPDGSPEIAEREAAVATGLAAMQKFDEASAIIERVLPVLEGAQPEHRKGLLDALSLRGYIAVFKADHDLAVETFERGLLLEREAKGDRPDVELARAIANLAAAYREAGRPADALRFNTEALAMAESLDPPPPDGALWYANRAVYMRELGRDDEAVAVAYEGLAYAERVLPAGHPLLANLYANLAMLLVRQGRPNAAIPLARQAFELVETAAGEPNQNSATMRAIFATALVPGRAVRGGCGLPRPGDPGDRCPAWRRKQPRAAGARGAGAHAARARPARRGGGASASCGGSTRCAAGAGPCPAHGRAHGAGDDLPDAAGELADLAHAIGAEDPLILIGEAATEAALRASVLAARASGRPQASHPALWGAFELVE